MKILVLDLHLSFKFLVLFFVLAKETFFRFFFAHLELVLRVEVVLDEIESRFPVFLEFFCFFLEHI